MTPAPKLSIQLSWASRGLQAVLSGQSSTDWLNQCPVEVRPGVQALLMMALRQLGMARALRQRLVSKSPAPAADALLTLSLGDRKSTRLNSSHSQQSRMPSSA